MKIKLLFMFIVPIVFSCPYIVSCANYHEHSVVNRGSGKLYNVTIFNKGKIFMHGVIIPDAEAGHSGTYSFNKNDIVEISWKTEDNKQVTKNVLIDKDPGSRAVVFEIKGDEVIVSYQTY